MNPVAGGAPKIPPFAGGAPNRPPVTGGAPNIFPLVSARGSLVVLTFSILLVSLIGSKFEKSDPYVGA